MNEVLVKWMTLFMALTIMFTPMLMYFDGYHKSAVDQVMHQAMKEASISGSFSTDIITKMETTLVDKYNFDPDSIVEIKGTIGSVPRGGFIDAEITVKRNPIFIINIFNQGSNTYTRPSTIMSESIQ